VEWEKNGETKPGESFHVTGYDTPNRRFLEERNPRAQGAAVLLRK
jgi:hypothetical protein